jgi:hypothetical protein
MRRRVSSAIARFDPQVRPVTLARNLRARRGPCETRSLRASANSINGGPSTTVSYAKTGWDKWTTVTLSVSLSAGASSLRFTKGTGYAELDSIELFN